MTAQRADAPPDQSQLRSLLNALRAREIAELLRKLPPAERWQAWQQVELPKRARVLLDMAPDVRRSIFRGAGKKAVDEALFAGARDIPVDDLAGLTAELPETVVRHMLESLKHSDRERLRRALRFSPDTAGALLNPDTVSVRGDVTVEVILRYLRMRRPLPDKLDSVFVVDSRERLLGTIPLERLATAQLDAVATSLIDTALTAVAPTYPAREVAQLFADRDLTSLAVVDSGGRLLGRITADDVVDVIREEGERAVRRLGQLPARADFLSGVFKTALQRSPWLGFGLLGSALTALVVLQFETTLHKAGELAALMPIVASLAGIFGMQTATVTVRGLALGHIGPRDHMPLLGRTALVGLLLWVMLGALVWIVAASWSESLFTSLATVAAVGPTLLVAAAFGVLAPVMLQRIRIDPLFATSGVTAITDVASYGSVLLLATWLLGR